MKRKLFFIAAFALICNVHYNLSAQTKEMTYDESDFRSQRYKYEPYLYLTTIIPGQNNTRMLSLAAIYSLVCNERSAIGIGGGIMSASTIPRVISVTPESFFELEAEERSDFNPYVKAEFSYRFNRNHKVKSGNRPKIKNCYPFITLGVGYMFIMDDTYQFSMVIPSHKDPDAYETISSHTQSVPFLGNVDLGLEYSFRNGDGPKLYASLSCTLMDMFKLHAFNFEAGPSNMYAKAILGPTPFNLAIKTGIRF